MRTRRSGLSSIVVAVLVLATVSAQEPPPIFEVASIRPSPRDSPYGTNSLWEFLPQGDVTFRNATLRLMIAIAYGIDTQFQHRLLAGTQATLDERFDIQAKAPAGATRLQSALMLRGLLEERFGLRTHVETREIPVLALTLTREGRLGRNLRRSDIDCLRFDRSSEPSDSRVSQVCGFFGIHRDAQKARLHDAGLLSALIRRMQVFVERPVQDATGLDGLFEWDVTFSVQRIPEPDSEFPTVEGALEDQLGLKLVPRNAPIEVRVIDSVQQPTEN
jgi:uncharacterized protein (TIGR03435 family)